MMLGWILLLVLLASVPATKPCPYDGEAAQFFAQRANKDAEQECGYWHNFYDSKKNQHYVHVFWTSCDAKDGRVLNASHERKPG